MIQSKASFFGNAVGVTNCVKTYPGKAIRSMPSEFYNQDSCGHHKTHETKGIVHSHVCSFCFAKEDNFMSVLRYSVDSRNFKKWGRSPTTAQNVGEGLKILGDDFMIKFKLMENTFSSLFRHF